MEYTGFTVWITGAAGAGKSSIAHELGARLRTRGHAVEILEGGVIREKLGRELGYNKVDYDEQVRRLGYVAGLLSRNGVAVICAATSPTAESRSEVRHKLGRFVEVFADAPHDVSNLRYKKKFSAQNGVEPLYQVERVSYEKPENPDVVCRTDQEEIGESVERILEKLQELNYITKLRNYNPENSPAEDELIRQRLKDLGYL